MSPTRSHHLHNRAVVLALAITPPSVVSRVVVVPVVSTASVLAVAVLWAVSRVAAVSAVSAASAITVAAPPQSPSAPAVRVRVSATPRVAAAVQVAAAGVVVAGAFDSALIRKTERRDRSRTRPGLIAAHHLRSSAASGQSNPLQMISLIELMY